VGLAHSAGETGQASREASGLAGASAFSVAGACSLQGFSL